MTFNRNVLPAKEASTCSALSKLVSLEAHAALVVEVFLVRGEDMGERGVMLKACDELVTVTDAEAMRMFAEALSRRTHCKGRQQYS